MFVLFAKATAARRLEEVPVCKVGQSFGTSGSRGSAADLVGDQPNEADPTADIRCYVSLSIDDGFETASEDLRRQ